MIRFILCFILVVFLVNTLVWWESDPALNALMDARRNHDPAETDLEPTEHPHILQSTAPDGVTFGVITCTNGDKVNFWSQAGEHPGAIFESAKGYGDIQYARGLTEVPTTPFETRIDLNVFVAQHNKPQ